MKYELSDELIVHLRESVDIMVKTKGMQAAQIGIKLWVALQTPEPKKPEEKK